MAEQRVYHERQEMLLCGLHALNSLLQGPHWDEISLATVAQALDRKEREVMAEAGMDTAEFRSFVAEESSNVANDGNFSIQVLTLALEIHNLRILNIDSQDAIEAKQQPQKEQAFICHLKSHWFSIRKVGGVWYDLNSLHAAPSFLGEFYLSAFLGTLKEEGWTVFVVRGIFPTSCQNPDTERSRYFTPAEAKQALLAAEEAKAKEQAFVAAQALADSFPPQVGTSNWQAFQGSGQRLGFSSKDATNGWLSVQPEASAPPSGMDVDDDYSRALAMSLQEEEERALMAAVVESTRSQQAEETAPTAVQQESCAVQDLGGASAKPLDGSSAEPIMETEPGKSAAVESGAQAVDAAGLDDRPPNAQEPTAHTPAAVEPPQQSEVGKPATEDAQSQASTPAMVELVVRMPNGERIKGYFQRKDCIAAVEDYVRKEIGSQQSFFLAESGPRGKDLKDKKMTLDEAGISNRTLLILKAALLG